RSAVSRPFRQRRQRGEDRVDVAAGLEAEHCAAVVEQVELDVTAAADELLLALGLVPGLREIGPNDLWVDLQECPADILGEGESRRPAALALRRRQPVVEDATDATHLTTMRQIEILVAPLLETWVVRDLMRSACALHRPVECYR